MIQVDLQNIRSFIPLPYEAALSPRLRIAHDHLQNGDGAGGEFTGWVRLPEDRLCGIVRNIGRDGQSRRILTLAELREAEVDMFCTVFIGNSAAKTVAGQLITPRGYRNV